MRRVGEITLSIIGAVLSLFGVIIWAITRSTFKLSEFREELIGIFDESIEMNELDGAMTSQEILESMDTIFPVLILSALVSTIIGIVAVFLLRGNKQPFAAGLVLIIGAVIVLVSSFATGFLAVILYVIAGIMTLVRKPPVDNRISKDNSHEDNVYLD